jgi:hypothetical protein
LIYKKHRKGGVLRCKTPHLFIFLCGKAAAIKIAKEFFVKKFRVFSGILVFLLVLGMAFTACGVDDGGGGGGSTSIVGEWENIISGITYHTLTFNSNGTFVFMGTDKGTYKVEGDIVILNYDDGIGGFVYIIDDNTIKYYGYPFTRKR